MSEGSYFLFVDVETTGLSATDRIVSLGAIGLDTALVQGSRFELEMAHLVFNPGIPCHPRASAVHGWTDDVLSRQPDFSESAADLSRLFNKATTIVAHNAKFDTGFIYRELIRAGQTLPHAPFRCTMEAWRNRYGTTGKLDDAIATLGLSRAGRTHGAFEDAWYAMVLWCALQDVEFPKPTPPEFPPTNYVPHCEDSQRAPAAPNLQEARQGLLRRLLNLIR